MYIKREEKIIPRNWPKKKLEKRGKTGKVGKFCQSKKKVGALNIKSQNYQTNFFAKFSLIKYLSRVHKSQMCDEIFTLY